MLSELDQEGQDDQRESPRLESSHFSSSSSEPSLPGQELRGGDDVVVGGLSENRYQVEPVATVTLAPQSQMLFTTEGTIHTDPTVISTKPPIELESDFVVPPPKPTITLPREVSGGGVLPEGTVLGHFKITKYIGGGGMGRVYEAIDQSLERRVAIKVLPNQRSGDQASIARFLNEARSAARLNHKHIAQVYYCGEDNGIPFIAFEYVEGVNVREYVHSEGVLSLSQAIDFSIQILDALAHASASGVTHRDVKPSNILITPEGKAKLIDMGLARLLKPAKGEEDLTASGMTLGTFDYISPEQARDPRETDVRSDIYSFGCTLYFMLTARPPYPEGTVLQKLLKHQGDSPPDIREFNTGLPQELSDIIGKMMAKNPKDRYQNPREASSALIRLGEKLGLVSPEMVESVEKNAKNSVHSRLVHHLPWIVTLTFLLGVVLFFRLTAGRDNQSILPNLPIPSPQASNGNQISGSMPTLSSNSSSQSSGGSSSETLPSPVAEEIPPLKGRLLDRLTLGENREIDSVSHTGNRKNSPVSSDKEKLSSPVTAGASGGTSISNPASQPIYLSGGFSGCPGAGAGGFDAGFVSSRQMPEPLSVMLEPAAFHAVSLFLQRESTPPVFRWATSRDAGLVNTNSSTGSGGAVSTPTLMVIDRVGKIPGTYSTLQAALSAANNVARTNTNKGAESPEIQIELRFSGTLEVPLSAISDRKVSITGGIGYRPTLTYKSGETSSISSGQRMFLLRNSQLRLSNLAIDFPIPVGEIISADWSAFELLEGSQLKIEESVLTIQNSYSDSNFSPQHTNVAFFRKSFLPVGAKSDQPTDSGEKLDRIIVNRSIIRGEATILQAPERGFITIDIIASALNTTGPVLKCDDYELGEKNEGLIGFTLEQSIAICSVSPFRHERKEGNAMLFPFSITLKESIVKLSDQPLMVSVSPYPIDEITTNYILVEDNVTLLNVSALHRHRQKQFYDKPIDLPLKNRNDKKLENFSGDAPGRISAIAPHLFTREDFYRFIYQPLESGLSNSADRKMIEKIAQSLSFSEK